MTCLVLVFDEFVMLVIHKVVPEKKSLFIFPGSSNRTSGYLFDKQKQRFRLVRYVHICVMYNCIYYVFEQRIYICRLCMFRVRNITMKCFTKVGRKR